MKAKGLIFDLNGTIINDFESHCYACQHLAKDYFNKEISINEIKSNIIGKTNELIVKSFADKPLNQDEINYYIDIKEKLYFEHVQQNNSLKLRDGVKLLFSYLQLKNIPYTIVATSNKDCVSKIINEFGLDQFINIDNVICDNNEFSNKKDMYDIAIKKFEIDSTKDIIVFEDSIPGIEAAIEAGCQRIVALYHKALHKYYKNYPQISIVTTSFIDVLYQFESKDIF